jgi:hypothetical protein
MPTTYLSEYRGFTIDCEPRQSEGRFVARVLLSRAGSSPQRVEILEPHVASFKVKEAAVAFGRRHGERWVDEQLGPSQPEP